MDRVNRQARSANMRAIRSKDMKPELMVRRLVHSLGYRYRLHRHDLPGRPDMVFSGRRKIIFVHGCFWHQHDDPTCKLAHAPRSNLDYWKPKLTRTRERDQTNRAKLNAAGWGVLVIWECEIRPGNDLTARIKEFLDMEIFSTATRQEGS